MEKFFIEQLVFDQHPIDPCALILKEPSTRWNELHDEVWVIPSGDVGPLGNQCGILGVHVVDQVVYNGRMR